MAAQPAGKKPVAPKPKPRKAPAPAARKKAAGVAAPRRKVSVKGRAPFGRPTDYKPEYNEQAYKFCLLGATDRRLAELFDVSEVTLNAWKKERPDFLKSLKAGKEIADAEVANSLYQRALGYSHPEDDIRALNGEIVVTPTIKHYPPDTAAATLWLKNRQPNVWRDKLEAALTGPDGGPIQARIAVEFVRSPPREEGDE